jgi:hypothetical protein
MVNTWYQELQAQIQQEKRRRQALMTVKLEMAQKLKYARTNAEIFADQRKHAAQHGILLPLTYTCAVESMVVLRAWGSQDAVGPH